GSARNTPSSSPCGSSARRPGAPPRPSAVDDARSTAATRSSDVDSVLDANELVFDGLGADVRVEEAERSLPPERATRGSQPTVRFRCVPEDLMRVCAYDGQPHEALRLLWIEVPLLSPRQRALRQLERRRSLLERERKRRRRLVERGSRNPSADERNVVQL